MRPESKHGRSSDLDVRSRRKVRWTYSSRAAASEWRSFHSDNCTSFATERAGGEGNIQRFIVLRIADCGKETVGNAVDDLFVTFNPLKFLHHDLAHRLSETVDRLLRQEFAATLLQGVTLLDKFRQRHDQLIQGATGGQKFQVSLRRVEMFFDQQPNQPDLLAEGLDLLVSREFSQSPAIIDLNQVIQSRLLDVGLTLAAMSGTIATTRFSLMPALLMGIAELAPSRVCRVRDTPHVHSLPYT